MSETARPGSAVAGVALLIAAAGLATGPLVDLLGRGDVDADDAAAGVAYLVRDPAPTVVSGLLLLVAGSALLVAAVAMRRPRIALVDEVAGVAGTSSGVLLALAGILRISAPGPIGYIAGIAEEDGRAAYLVVQTVGTQLLYPAATLGIAVWIVLVVIPRLRRGEWPPAVGAVMLPAAVVILGVAGPLLPSVPDVLFVGRVAALVAGLPLALAVLAAVVLVRTRRPPARRTSS